MALPVQEHVASHQRPLLSPRLIDRVALLLIAAQVGYFAWSTSTTWFRQDDYVELLLASRAGGFPGTLFQEFNGHLIPAALALVSGVHWLFGMNWSAVVAIAAVMQLAASVLTWLAIRSFLGPRLLTLFLFVSYLSSVLVFQTLLWWCTINIYLPLQIAFPAALLLLQLALRKRSIFYALLPSAAVLIGSLFFEKCLTITPFLIILVAATQLTPTSKSTPRERLREAKLPLLVLVATTVAYGLVYQLITHSSPSRPQLDLSRLSTFSLDPLFRVFLPSFTGGPFPVGRISASGPGGFNFDLAGSTQMWVNGLMALGLFVWSVVTFKKVLRYWAIISGFALVNLAIIILSGRKWSSLNPRYYSELVFPTILLLGLALGVGRFADTPRRRVARSGSNHFAKVPKVLMTAIASIFLIAIATSNMNGMREVLAPAPARSYSANALRSSAAIGHPVTLIRQYVDKSLINGIFLRNMNFTYVILQPMAGPWAFADAATDAYMVREDGTVVPATSSRQTIPLYKPGLCNIDLHDGIPKRLELNRDLFRWSWHGSISAAARNDVEISVEWGAAPTTFSILNGPSTTLFFINGGGDSITLTAKGGDVCVTDLGFGKLVEDQSR
jgi:hypothetical protein